MICILALIVFGILGIFSATHRKIAFEAFDCVFKRITLRKCDTGLDQRLKSQITGHLMRKNYKAGAWTFKHFETLSWIFTIIFITSMVYAGIGGYNYYLYGNCNGPNAEGFCIFDPAGNNVKYSTASDSASCSTQAGDEMSLSLLAVDTSLFPQTNQDAENQVFFIGCYACEYTRKAYPEIRKLSLRDDTNFIFAHLPVKDQTEFISDVVNCVDAKNPKKVLELNDLMFSMNVTQISEKNAILDAVKNIGLNPDEVEQCAAKNETKQLSQKQTSEIKETGVYGTPTVFINGEAVVGPKPFRVYKRLLK
ncbi:MAG: DsbA family protein [Nanoarchaeota archaeon]|nr:DsbA family protein [Nanoarchaeota archaeon]